MDFTLMGQQENHLYEVDTNTGTSALHKPADGAGVMIAGELWDSFLPPNVAPYYSEANQPLIGTFLRIGNFDREWSTPTHMWPGGWPYGMFWAKGMYLAEFNPDSTWNPPTIAGNPNPAYKQDAGGEYALGSYFNTVLGANDLSRNYSRETRWTDSTKRHHAIYEAGWPTNIGVDVRIKIHQFTLNWNNFNDFIIVEIALTNTGVLDMNVDGIPDSVHTGRSGRNRINALTMMSHGEVYCSYSLSRTGGRGTRFGATRAIGYVGDTDTGAAPWDMVVAFPGESQSSLRDMGFNDWPDRYYTDIWSAWAWIAVKEGVSDVLHSLPDKQTIYQTHGIGTGSQRGWYASAGQGRGLDISFGGNLRSPKLIHTTAMGTWYRDGGKSRSEPQLDLSPDPNFFASGTSGNPVSFVPKSNPSRPRGDRKLLSEEPFMSFEVNRYEPNWKKGFTAANNFDGDLFSGIGPFSLDVGETMTIVWAEAGGYRLQGVQNAIAAARWAFENGYALPEPPPVPEMKPENTFSKSVRVRWDNRSEARSDFAGYKLYRLANYKPVDWILGGMRGLDEYWRSTVPGPTPSDLLKPINPSFNTYDSVTGHYGNPGSWGPYELVKVIPRADLSRYQDRSVPSYTYSWEDSGVDMGFRYWYYVSAYTTGSYDLGPVYAGLNNPVSNTLETSNVNRNGATGLWENTYPFADLNSFFPKTDEGKKAIGAGFDFLSALANPRQIVDGTVRVGVRPNPYKKKALWDRRADPFDHKLMFYNLPPKATITILDVSGQIVDQLRFASTDPQNGSIMWGMFSKNGVEVASGVYVYVVEFDGGQQVGYFSIMR